MLLILQNKKNLRDHEAGSLKLLFRECGTPDRDSDLKWHFRSLPIHSRPESGSKVPLSTKIEIESATLDHDPESEELF